MAAGVCFSSRLLHARALNEVLTIAASDEAPEPAWISHPQLNVFWGIPTWNAFLMTERLQQLQGESLSNERRGNAPALTNARSPECEDEDVCSGIHDLLVVIYGGG